MARLRAGHKKQDKEKKQKVEQDDQYGRIFFKKGLFHKSILFFHRYQLYDAMIIRAL
jgi:hypothetical protein